MRVIVAFASLLCAQGSPMWFNHDRERLKISHNSLVPKWWITPWYLFWSSTWKIIHNSLLSLSTWQISPQRISDDIVTAITGWTIVAAGGWERNLQKRKEMRIRGRGKMIIKISDLSEFRCRHCSESSCSSSLSHASGWLQMNHSLSFFLFFRVFLLFMSKFKYDKSIQARSSLNFAKC